MPGEEWFPRPAAGLEPPGPAGGVTAASPLFFSFTGSVQRAGKGSFASTLQPVMLVMIPRGMRRPRFRRMKSLSAGEAGRWQSRRSPLGSPAPGTLAPAPLTGQLCSENCDGWALHERTGEFKSLPFHPSCLIFGGHVAMGTPRAALDPG